MVSRASLGVLLVIVMLTACAAGPNPPTVAPTTGAKPAAGAGTGTPPAGSRLPVVATFSILGDLVQAVGGDRIALRVLVPAGTDAHTFTPAPSDSAALAEAVLIFENGVGFDAWLDKLYTASGATGRRVVVTEGIALLEAEAHDDDDDDAKPTAGTPTAAEHDDHDEHDPHVWHDVQHAIHMTTVIRDTLVRADTANAEYYRANAERYLKELATLDTWIVEQTRTIPAAQRKLVTSHDTFRYFAARYGFTVIGTALGSITTETSEPSAGEFATLVDGIKAAGVPAIFAENVANPKLVERLAREAGVTLGPALYTDALGQPGSSGDSYLKLMRANVTAMATALKR